MTLLPLLLALVLGVVPNIPGFFKAAGFVADVPDVFETVYTYAWFVGLAIAAGVYWAAMRMRQRP